jgi:sec-independent protein translocase protein TatA
MLGGLGPTELIIVLVIILVVFGAGKLPDIASGLGKGIRDFKKGVQDLEEEDSGPSGKGKKAENEAPPDNPQG